MLEIKNISKIYCVEDFKQNALDNVSIKFRENEFASILGPSGSGKTTLLNIIGGLDQYTDGDLIINGTSTKKYKDRDWDSYRNHSIGFVFQSYNLIPHQTALSNVELALTLSGVSKEERRKRAKEVLKKVGLEEHINKRPTQMSGGQMQRIAIARALINDPDILLADEPTGALDSETSVQIMALLKEIAKEKLVIMVTHNAELAEEYSTRIIKLKDGRIVDDTNPVTKAEKEGKDAKKHSKTSMSFFTALSLSLNNLLTKKTRTILTAFAGSIGIIGIALILSLSSGMQSYIKRVEEDTLSSYPITIEKSTVDATAMLSSLMENTKHKQDHENDKKIYSNDIMGEMINNMASQIQTNNLEEFKKYIDDKSNKMINNSNAIQYSYNLNLQIYKSDTSDGVVKVNPNTVFETVGVANSMESSSNSMMGMGMKVDVFQELLDNKDLLKSQYDVLAGSWPSAYNEVVLMINDNNEISDFALYALGLKDQSELSTLMKDIMAGKQFEFTPTSYSYDEMLNLTFKLVLNSDYYEKSNGIWIDKNDDEEYMKKVIEKAPNIKIVGIVKPNEDAKIMNNSGGIGYTSDLTRYVIKEINESTIAKEQTANEKINVFTGREFTTEGGKFDISSLSAQEQAYLMSLSQEELSAIIAAYTANMSTTYEDNLLKIGVIDLENPDTINIYPKDFESKEAIQDIIANYNKIKTDAGQEELVINYSDLIGLMMSSVSTIINAITYVLIAFVAISLVVSSIMIGIITYISVLERTKEIGILRAIGASKKDISRVFNAETIIEGLASGLLGIVITLILNVPANMIIKNVTGISKLSTLPIAGGITLVIISVVLTVIAGLIPSKIAAKKDPVEALRTE